MPIRKITCLVALSIVASACSHDHGTAAVTSTEAQVPHTRSRHHAPAPAAAPDAATPGAGVVVAVNAGGDAYRDGAGLAWSADTGYSGGNAYSVSTSIAGTPDPALYQSQRWGDMRYSFPVPDGRYTIVLKFAEIYWSDPGMRLFDVAVNGARVLADFDILAAAGGAYKAIDQRFTVEVTSGAIDVALTRAGADEAALNAIEILAAGTEPPVAAPPSLYPGEHRRLAMSGTVFYPTGYYGPLDSLIDPQRDHQAYLDALAAGGINYVRGWFSPGQHYGTLTDVYLRTGPGNANDGGPKFDLDQFDQATFDRYRRVVQYAASKGIIVQVCILDAWHNAQLRYPDSDSGWGLMFDYYYGDNNVNGVSANSFREWQDPENAAYARHQALIRKLVDTIGDLPNIVWEVANESGNTGWETGLGDDTITPYEASKGFAAHLVMPRDLPGHQYVPLEGANCENDPLVTHQTMAAAFGQNVPLLSDNDCNDIPTAAGRRAKAWAVLTAGGQIDLFHFGMDLSQADTRDGIRYVGYLGAFLAARQVSLLGMRPADDLVSSGWAYARSGDEYVVYLANGGTTTISGLPAAYDAAWFDPRVGGVQPATGGPSFSAPTSDDWVLHVRRAP